MIVQEIRQYCLLDQLYSSRGARYNFWHKMSFLRLQMFFKALFQRNKIKRNNDFELEPMGKCMHITCMLRLKPCKKYTPLKCKKLFYTDSAEPQSSTTDQMMWLPFSGKNE